MTTYEKINDELMLRVKMNSDTAEAQLYAAIRSLGSVISHVAKIQALSEFSRIDVRTLRNLDDNGNEEN